MLYYYINFITPIGIIGSSDHQQINRLSDGFGRGREGRMKRKCYPKNNIKNLVKEQAL